MGDALRSVAYHLRAKPDFAKENLNVVAQYGDHANVVGDIDRVREIGREPGALVRQGLKKIAVYRDSKGTCINAPQYVLISGALWIGTILRKPGIALARVRVSTRSAYLNGRRELHYAPFGACSQMHFQFVVFLAGASTSQSDQSQFQICCFESNPISFGRILHKLPPQNQTSGDSNRILLPE